VVLLNVGPAVYGLVVPVPKKRARPRKSAKPPFAIPSAEELDKATNKLTDEFMQRTVEKLGIAVKDNLQALLEVTEDLSDAVDALHERVEALEALQGISYPRQAINCDCENCRLRWN
jgi:hypothetical protein